MRRGGGRGRGKGKSTYQKAEFGGLSKRTGRGKGEKRKSERKKKTRRGKEEGKEETSRLPLGMYSVTIAKLPGRF